MSLKVEALSYTYMKGTPFEKKALDNVTFEIETGEFVGIIGHTGCGKSTLVQHFNGLLKPEEGNIYIDGKLMNHSNIKDMRKQVGLVFQYPEYQLFESTVYKDIAFGIRSEGLSHEEEYRRVLDAAEKTGLSEDLLENSIYDLSGGQKRRAAIAGINCDESGNSRAGRTRGGAGSGRARRDFNICKTPAGDNGYGDPGLSQYGGYCKAGRQSYRTE